MNDLNRQSSETRERILKAASRLFADRGYRGTSVELICKAANVNIAAVNYHFGSKENLYQRVWRHAHDEMVAKIPPDGGVGEDRPAAERLRGRIRAALQRAMFGDAVEFGIMRNEMANPTGLLYQVIEDAIRPIRQATQAILRELLGPKASHLDVELCEVCVVAPWMHMTHHRQAQAHEGLAPIFREDMLESMVEHFTAFSLAGIGQIGRRIEKSSSIPKNRSSARRKKARTP